MQHVATEVWSPHPRKNFLLLWTKIMMVGVVLMTSYARDNACFVAGQVSWAEFRKGVHHNKKMAHFLKEALNCNVINQ